MRPSSIVAVASAILLHSQPIHASPITDLVPRQKASILKTVLELFGTFFPKAEVTWCAKGNLDTYAYI